MSVVIPNRQQLVQNCYAYASDLGIMLVSNGEERPFVLSPDGLLVNAGFLAPTNTPTVADNGMGNLPDTKFCVYAVVYVMKDAYPNIGRRQRSNPSAYSIPFQINSGGVDRQNTVSFVGSAATNITHVEIYRTDFHLDADTAQLAAEAGSLFYLGEVTNTVGALTYDDNIASNIGNDPIELDNFEAPQFRFCVFDGEYFWGFANHPLLSTATWTSAGVVTMTGTGIELFANGRTDQFVTFDTVTTGGIDGRGTFKFKYVSSGTFQTVDDEGADLSIGALGSGDVVVSGPPADLYRSKYRNPFAWGYMRAYTDVFVPERWAIRVSGSLGTAIAIFPDQNLLKLDMEFPALCVSYNLQTSSTDVFETTRRTVSRAYSVSSHFSQFEAVSNGQNLLWGMDFKNYAIIESNGVSQQPISGPISSILKSLAPSRILQLLSHGIYDPYTEINAIWVSVGGAEVGADFKNDLCIFHHAPTGYWGVVDDYDISCSASIEDANSSRKRILVGTESGHVGYAFQPGVFGNWLPPTGSKQGTVTAVAGDGSYIETGDASISASNEGGYVIIVSPDGLTEQVRLIYGVGGGGRLAFNKPLDLSTPVGSKFFIGLIKVSVLKYFDKGMPSTDKMLAELWATISGASAPKVRYYLEHSKSPTASLDLKRDSALDAWFAKTGFPTKKLKTFGVEIVDHTYDEIRFFNMTIK